MSVFRTESEDKVVAGDKFFFTDAASKDQTESKYYYITIPSGMTNCALRCKVTMSNTGYATFNENPTISVAGTGLTEYNADRNSTETTTVAALDDPTVGADGTCLDKNFFAANGSLWFFDGDPIIAKAAEDYLVRIYCDNDSTNVSIYWEWYKV